MRKFYIYNMKYNENIYDDFSDEEKKILRKNDLIRRYKGKKISVKDINDIINNDRWDNLYGGDC